MSRKARMQAVSVDEAGIRFRSRTDVVVDVCFDGRRIWSFWLRRDSARDGSQRLAAWPPVLKRFLDGTTRLTIIAHTEGTTLYDEEVRLGSGDGRIAVVDEQGHELGLDKSNRITQTFSTRSAEHVAPLLDSIEELLGAVRSFGIEAFLAYGTLLGAVRDQKLIGHDSDADLGYISACTTPVDAMLESFALQRELAKLGYPIQRYSGLAIKVGVKEADGSVRGLDIFGGFVSPSVDGEPEMLYLMGEVGTPISRDRIYPLTTATLEGRTFPVPADADAVLQATYGPGWRVPDPAFHFTTPRSTVRRLDGWFRGLWYRTNDWERWSSGRKDKLPAAQSSALAEYVREREGADLARLVDIGAGRCQDALGFARSGTAVTAYDLVPWASNAAQEVAVTEGLDLRVHALNLNSIRSWLSAGADLANGPQQSVVVARHVVDAITAYARDGLWRMSAMALHGGGRLYLEFHSSDAIGAGGLFLHPVDAGLVRAELERHGATIVHSEERASKTNGEPGWPVTRMVAQW